jgi:hypothetical protein
VKIPKDITECFYIWQIEVLLTDTEKFYKPEDYGTEVVAYDAAVVFARRLIRSGRVGKDAIRLYRRTRNPLNNVTLETYFVPTERVLNLNQKRIRYE